MGSNAAGVLPPVTREGATTDPLTYKPRAPSTLVLIDTATTSGTSTVSFGYDVASLLSSSETALSAVVYAPNGTCTAGPDVISGRRPSVICNCDGASARSTHRPSRVMATGTTS